MPLKVLILGANGFIGSSLTRAIRLTRACVLDQIKNDPALADHLSRNLARRLQDMAGQLRCIDQTLARLDQPFEIAFPMVLARPLALDLPMHSDLPMH